MTRAVLTVFLMLGALAAAAPIHAADRRIPYQGRIEGTSGSVTMGFTIYDASGAAIWGPELHVLTPDAGGRFAAVIGSTAPDGDQDGIPDLDQIEVRDLQLEVSVNGAALEPRESLVSTYHAAGADRAESAARVATASVAQSALSLAAASVTTASIVDGTITEADLDPTLADRLPGYAIMGTYNAPCPSGSTFFGRVWICIDGSSCPYVPLCTW
jgi:hypothetical protein